MTRCAIPGKAARCGVKVILFGAPFHGHILHRIPDDVPALHLPLNHEPEPGMRWWTRTVFVLGPNLTVFATEPDLVDRDTLTVWRKLLTDEPPVFSTIPKINRGRKRRREVHDDYEHEPSY